MAAFSSISAFFLASFSSVLRERRELPLRGGLAQLEPLDLRANSTISWLCWSLYAVTVESWSRKPSGSSERSTWLVVDSAWPWYCATTVEATRWRIASTFCLLPVQVGPQ